MRPWGVQTPQPFLSPAGSQHRVAFPRAISAERPAARIPHWRALCLQQRPPLQLPLADGLTAGRRRPGAAQNELLPRLRLTLHSFCHAGLHSTGCVWCRKDCFPSGLLSSGPSCHTHSVSVECVKRKTCRLFSPPRPGLVLGCLQTVFLQTVFATLCARPQSDLPVHSRRRLLPHAVWQVPVGALLCTPVDSSKASRAPVILH